MYDRLRLSAETLLWENVGDRSLTMIVSNQFVLVQCFAHMNLKVGLVDTCAFGSPEFVVWSSRLLPYPIPRSVRFPVSRSKYHHRQRHLRSSRSDLIHGRSPQAPCYLIMSKAVRTLPSSDISAAPEVCNCALESLVEGFTSRSPSLYQRKSYVAKAGFGSRMLTSPSLSSTCLKTSSILFCGFTRYRCRHRCPSTAALVRRDCLFKCQELAPSLTFFNTSTNSLLTTTLNFQLAHAASVSRESLALANYKLCLLTQC